MLPATNVAAARPPGRRPRPRPAGRRPPERLGHGHRRRRVRTAMPQLSSEASDFSWLVDNFAKRTPGVAHAMVVSADGLPIAVSQRLDRPKADQLAAIACGLASLTQGSARCIHGGLVKQTVVEMDRGLLVVMAISDGSCLTVLAGSACDVGMVAYENDRAGQPHR